MPVLCHRFAVTSLLTVCWLVGLTVSIDAADIINRRGGATRVAGQITAMTSSDVTIKPVAGDPQVISVSEIANIEWDDTPSEFKLAIADEANARLAGALARLEKIKTEGKATTDNLKAELDYAIARVTARAALGDPAQIDAAAELLRKWCASQPDHYRLFEGTALLGQLLLAKGDAAGARTAFEKISGAPTPELQLTGKIALARVLMSEQKYDEAIAAFDSIVAGLGDVPSDKARRYEALLGKSRGLIAKGLFAEALPLLEDIAINASADDISLQAEVYLLQGNSLQALNRNKEAVLAYLHVDVLFSRETAAHAESLYHLTRLWKEVQLPERGLEARAKLEGNYPNSEWAKKLAGVSE